MAAMYHVCEYNLHIECEGTIFSEGREIKIQNKIMDLSNMTWAQNCIIIK
jgi:hypothetical protein